MTNVKMGHLVVIEGNERVGKTTQRELLKKALEEKGYEVVVTREPGGTPFGEKIRDLIKHSEYGRDLDPATELMLIGAQRQEHNDQVIFPALEAGKVVLCDRNFYSTFAHQVHPYQRDDLMHLFSTVTNVNQMALDNTQPIMVNLKLDEEIRQQRLAVEQPSDNFEKRSKAYLDCVTEAYGMLEQQPGALTYDANIPAAELSQLILRDVLDCFEQQREAAVAATDPQAPAAEEVIEEDQPVAPEVTFDELGAAMLAEIDVHGTKLEEIYGKEMEEPLRKEWDEHKETLRKWVGLHLEELGGVIPPHGASNHLRNISGNIGQILGSWLTLQNIRGMVDESQTKTN